MNPTPSNTPATPDLSDRDLRQREIVPPEALAACHAVIIGVGAVGRQVALQLAAVGVASLDLIDFDAVGVANLAPQGYWPEDLGRPKVEATADVCRRIHPCLDVAVHNDRFRRSSAKSIPALNDAGRRVAVFACVDSITTRGIIWEVVKEKAAFYVDGRMSAEVVRVLASGRPASDNHYHTTLFGDDQAYAGSCTAKSTIYSASIAAGLMVGQFTRWLRGLPLDRDVLLNLLSMELAVA